MSDWQAIKKRAREKHAALVEAAGGDESAAALLAAADRATGFGRAGRAASDSILMGAEAVLDPEVRRIWFNEDADPLMIPPNQMHEYAHLWEHVGSHSCSAGQIDLEAEEEEIPLGVARVESYGPREREEREANVFTREVLLPSDKIRRWVIEDGMTAEMIASKVGVPIGMVHHQLSFALLVSDLVSEPAGKSAPAPQPPLDESQKIAAEWTGGPLLVEAGPGTGKTRTLVGRVEFLLGQGVEPESILALTFSNKAAEEMRSRVAVAAPEAASKIWMGTFHAFGLELLRKYGSCMGIPGTFEMIDPVEGMFLLERHLPVLGLEHYRNLYEPTRPIPDILSAISRAKDELVGPTAYMSFAEKMLADAGDDEDKILAARKVVEVARVYDFYQRRIEEESRLDFGDLISRTVAMLREHPDVRDDLRRKFAHILVDEYQDVNRASGILLRELAGDGTGLWVVGDTRQSIYRFRGAAPVNVKKFPEEFPGSRTLPLEVNYRSRPRIVAAVAELAPQMKATDGRGFKAWRAHRNSEPGVIAMEIADDLVAEGAGIAREVERLNAAGIAYRDQAVLCRSHTVLARVAALLEDNGVPVHYLGDLFEREEIRDLLALVSLAGGGDGRGLVRVAEFPEYRIPLADVVLLIKAAKEASRPFPGALALAADVEGISEDGRRGLGLLTAHFDGISYGTNAWGMLVRYLFGRSGYLSPLLTDASLGARQKRLAIHQFLQFAHAQRTRIVPEGKDPKRAFLSYVRRLEIHGDERQLRQVPEWAAGLNAVRVLTVHASKGLEFDAVFLPYLGKGTFPASPRHKDCPPPVGMLSSDAADGSHAEEEECLFFVALSRAKEYLCLSRAARYGSKGNSPSDFLSLISRSLPSRPDSPPTWLASRPPAPAIAMPALNGDRPVFDARDLDVYIKCPRKYYYEFVLGLSGKREDGAYVQFHRCVYELLRWIGGERTGGGRVDHDGASAKLAEIWARTGPCGHAFEVLYRESAEGMIAIALGRIAIASKSIPSPKWEVPRQAGTITIVPDFLEESAESVGALRFRTGKLSKKETEGKGKDIYAVYQAAIERFHPRRGRASVISLSTGETREVALSKKMLDTRLGHYDDAIVGIRSRLFPPVDNGDRDCPRCPHYFICPAGAKA